MGNVLIHSTSCSTLIKPKKIPFGPYLVLFSGWLSYVVEFFVGAWFMEGLPKKSFICKGHQSSQHVNAFPARHCLNLYSTGSQFVVLNYIIPTWDLLSSWRQKRIHLFWRVCKLVLIFLLTLGYQTEHA